MWLNETATSWNLTDQPKEWRAGIEYTKKTKLHLFLEYIVDLLFWNTLGISSHARLTSIDLLLIYKK